MGRKKCYVVKIKQFLCSSDEDEFITQPEECSLSSLAVQQQIILCLSDGSRVNKLGWVGYSDTEN